LIADWWRTFGADPVTAKDLLSFADEIVPDDGKKPERSRVTRLGALLAQRIGATFEIDGYKDGYVKIVRAEVGRAQGRTAGGTHAGCALKEIPKADPLAAEPPAAEPPAEEPPETPDEVGQVGGDPKKAKNPAETKENFPANLTPQEADQNNEVGRPQVPDFKEKNAGRPTRPTSEGENGPLPHGGIQQTQDPEGFNGPPAGHQNETLEEFLRRNIRFSQSTPRPGPRRL
jgi:hypothetical protein